MFGRLGSCCQTPERYLHDHEYVFCYASCWIIYSLVDQNPFASTHSLDTNPFDDPTPQQPGDAARLDQLRQRELDLERREQELAAKADHLRRNGRNNWPPCPSPAPVDDP
jgi:hypothetical protein